MAEALLGIDYGEARVGLAYANKHERPQRLKTLATDEQLIAKLVDIIGEHVGLIILGLPRGEDGQETKQSRAVYDFKQRLEAATSVPIVLVDEFGTSAVARQRLAKHQPTKESGLIDQESAVILLEDYLAGF